MRQRAAPRARTPATSATGPMSARYCRWFDTGPILKYAMSTSPRIGSTMIAW